jgi:hypothetical protein
MEARLAELEAAIEALKGEPVYEAADIAAGGAFVSLGFDGGVRVERGFIRKVDEAPVTRNDDAGVEAAAGGPKPSNDLPEKLVAQLTAQRTAALREAVAGRPDVAFIAVVHALAASAFYVGNRICHRDHPWSDVHRSEGRAASKIDVAGKRDEGLARDAAWPRSTYGPPRRGHSLCARALAGPHPVSR